MSALKNAMKLLNLKPVKRIHFAFDPYHQNVISIRDALSVIKSSDIIKTNPECRTKVEIKSDRTEPIMNVEFKDGLNLKMKTELLSTVDILEQLGIICLEKAPPAVEPVTAVETTKKSKLKRK